METNSTPNPISPKEQLPDMNMVVKGWAKASGRSLSELNRKLGRHHNFLQKTLRNRDIRPSVLIALSKLLSINLFEYYIAMLPESYRLTIHEKQLLRQIEELKKELEQVKAERDKYWRAIADRK